jgi:site-specific DNA-adenine methylase
MIVPAECSRARVARPPLLKWAGGKRWLVNRPELHIPEKFDRYVEPFFGGGALFFHLRPRAALLADINADLIETYRSVRDDWRRVDPPYTVKHNVNGFLKYNQTLFSWEDQIRLRDEVVAARDRGAKVLVSNAAHESLRSLYANVGELVVLERASVIAGTNSGRKREQEILIKCY